MWDNSNIPEKLLLRIYPGELDKGQTKTWYVSNRLLADEQIMLFLGCLEGILHHLNFYYHAQRTKDHQSWLGLFSKRKVCKQRCLLKNHVVFLVHWMNSIILNEPLLIFFKKLLWCTCTWLFVFMRSWKIWFTLVVFESLFIFPKTFPIILMFQFSSSTII